MQKPNVRNMLKIAAVLVPYTSAIMYLTHHFG